MGIPHVRFQHCWPHTRSLTEYCYSKNRGFFKQS